MGEKSKFCKCFTEFLSILNIKGSSLARGINVDPSVVSRWKTGKRIIPSNSNYLELISSFLSNNITNDFQKNKVLHIAKKYNIPIDFEDSKNMNDYIYNILLWTKQYSSIECCEDKTDFETKFIRYKSNISPDNSIKNKKINCTKRNTSVLNNSLFVYEKNMSSHIIENMFNEYSLSKNSEIITGQKNIIQAVMNLLKSALNVSCNNTNESIVMTFLSEQDFFSNFDQTYYKWSRIIDEVMIKGWNITKIIRLNDNVSRTLKIINEIKKYFFSGKYYPYCLEKYSFLIAFDFIIVPKVGAIVCFGSQTDKKFDSAFFTRSEEAMKILGRLFKQFLDHSSPLFDSYKSVSDLDLINEVIKCEEKNGDRFVLKNGLSVMTIPNNLYSRYVLLNKHNKSADKIFKKIYYHKRRLEAFYSQIDSYNFYDIYPKQAIENLIKSGEYLVTNTNSSDVLIHIQNVIYMLEKYNNYQIALTQDNELFNSINYSITIKDSDAVIMQSNNRYKTKFFTNAIPNNNNINSGDVAITIYEPTVVNAFKNYFLAFYEKIPPINKNKDYVISWLKNQIKSIK